MQVKRLPEAARNYDLSATFNTVNHHLLLNRLKYRFGICDLVLSWVNAISQTGLNV